MKRMLAFAVLLAAAAAVAMTGPQTVTAGAAPSNTIHTGGFWTTYKGENSAFVVMNGDGRNAYLGFMRSANHSKACEFAIGVDRDEVHFQIVDAKGGIHIIPVTALLKLEEDKPKSSDAPVAKAKDEIPAGHKLLYRMARIRAAGELADKEKISRRAAREKIDDALSDAELHQLVTAAGVTVKPGVSGGKVQDLIQWLIDHQDAILAIVKIILALFQAAAEVEDSSIFLPHDWAGLLFAMAA